MFIINVYCTGFNGTSAAPPASNNTFVSDSNFSSVFGAAEAVGKSFPLIYLERLKFNNTLLKCLRLYAYI